MTSTPRLSAIARLSACLSKLHGERCRISPRASKIEAFQDELESAALAVVGLNHSGLLPTCGACHGSGRRDLTPTEAITLASVPCEFFGKNLDKANGLDLGDEVLIAVNLRGRESGGKFYGSNDAWHVKVTRSAGGPPPPTDDDQLPF